MRRGEWRGVHLWPRLRIESLQMKCAAAPFFRSDIGDGFGKVPAVAMKVLSVVLALTVGMILRFGQNNGPIPPRALAVTLGIFNANLNNMRSVGYPIAFGYGEAAIPGFHLDAVIANAKTDSEAKSLRQPIGRHSGIRIDKHRNDNAGRHRAVESHLQNLSLNPVGSLR